MILFNENIEAIIFDMDGVLLDSETISIESWRQAAAELGISKDDIDTAQMSCMGTNINDTVNYLDNRYKGKIEGFDGDTFRKRTSVIFAEMVNGKPVPLMPYARECLEALSKQNVKIALASSTRESTVRRQLSEVDLLKYFESITTGDMVEHSKPEPDIYLKACESIGVEAKNCAAVEDSPNGARSAISAGMKTIVIPDKLQPPADVEAKAFKILTSLKDLF